MSYVNSIDTDDLTNPSSTRKYKLGARYVDNSDTNAIKKEYVYVKAHGALTQYQPYQLSVVNTAGAEVSTKAPATTASGATVVAPQVAVTSGYYAWVPYRGIVTVLTTDTFAAGDYAEVLNAGTGLKLDGGVSGSTAEGAGSVGIATTATSGGSASFVLSGNAVAVAAS
ncbi:MAG: hypothetical protein VW397_07450 [Candidatus Margulisiibacteriota bacterium]